MVKMNARERVLTTLNHEEPDKVPSFEISIDNLPICNHFGEEYVFQGTVDAFSNTSDLVGGDSKKLTAAILRATETRSAIKNLIKRQANLYQKVGIDLMAVPIVGWFFHPRHCEKDSLIDEYGRIFDLTKYKDGMDVAYYKEGLFKTFEEYEASEPIDPDSPRREKFYKGMKKVEQESNGKIFTIPSMFGVMETVWQAFGFVNFSKMVRKSQQIKRLFDDRGKLIVELIKRLIEWGDPGAVWIYDDWGYKSGLLMGVNRFKEYVIPWYKRICDTAHKGGVKIMLHSCGDVHEVFPDIISAGVDSIHPIEPTTANPDFDIFKLNQKFGDDITLIGNVSPQDLTDKNEKYIEDYTKRLLTEIAPNGGFILSSGHSITPSIKLENFLAMHKTLKNYGNYNNT